MKFVFKNKQDLEIFLKKAIAYRKYCEEIKVDKEKLKQVIDIVRTLKEVKEKADELNIKDKQINWVCNEYEGEYGFKHAMYIDVPPCV